VAVSKDGEVRIQRVVGAVDCGIIVNPDTVKAQIEGGIILRRGGHCEASQETSSACASGLFGVGDMHRRLARFAAARTY
jgi:Molybdopterin-binding domain of aldehyde dehydrogenase